MKKKLLQITILCTLILNTSLCAWADYYSEARQLIRRAKTASINEQSYDYLHQARVILEKEYENNQTNIKLLMILSEVYQLLEDRQQAKLYALQAYNIAPNNMYVQRAMGDFYYAFQEYTTALEYYKLSLITGLLQDFETNVRVAECYEKLGDSQNAEVYFQVCNFLNPDSQAIQNKLNAFASARKPDNSETLENAKYKYLYKDKPKTEEEETQEEVDKIITQIHSAF